MSKILISACLLGDKVRYDGTGKLLQHPLIKKWQAEERLQPICPEMTGGLPTPRPPAEIQKHRIILTDNGKNVTEAFQKGAHRALELCQQNGIKAALLKANSPSCGNQHIYDGSFSGKLVKGAGITAQLLSEHGVVVFNEQQISELATFLEGISEPS